MDTMDSSPIQAAEEAALAAVNLGPAISPSSRIPETTESLTHTHGLLILERDPTGEPTWFACKFCPIFGTKKKRKGYLRLYRTPFKLSQMESHLKTDHAEQWRRYRVLDLEQKRQFFHGKRLPPPTVFQERMKELEKIWAPSTRKRKAPKLAVDANGEIQNIHPMKRHKLFIEHNFSKPLATDDDWIGRKTFRPAASTAENVHSKTPKCERPLPGRNIGKLLSGVLERYSEPFSEDIQRLIKRSSNPADEEDTASTPPWSADGTVMLAARALFYLLRGLPVDVTSTLLQESAHFGCLLVQPSHADVKIPDIAEEPTVEQETAIRESLPDAKPDIAEEPTLKQETTISESPPDRKPVIQPESLVTFVSSTARFIEMAAFLALKRIIEERHTWAIALATRPCPMRNDALEIMIPILAPSLELSCRSKAKEVPSSANTASQLTNIETEIPPPDLADVNHSVIYDNHEQSAVKASVAKLLSLAVTIFLLGEVRENLSVKAPMKLRRGVHERVRLVLMDALEFFCETIGPNRASASLKAILNVRKLETNWLLSAQTDDEAIESANSNYKAVGLNLSEVELQTEKEVLGGLRLCVRTAKDSLRGSFHSPTIYAREVLNKAVDRFDTINPALRQIPTEQGPLHLISVRDSADAVETVTRCLDFVCPHWCWKLIGINSNISGDSPLKLLETKLVEALKQRKGSDFVIVEKSDNKPPTLPSDIMNMAPHQFEDLILSYIKDNSPPRNRFVDKLRKQRETLFYRRQDKMNDSWTSHEDLRTLVTFIRAIEMLWSRNHCKIGRASQDSGIIGGEADDRVTSDRDIEQILRARTLMDAEQRRLLHEEDPGMLWTDFSSWKDYLVSWGENWSNLMFCASD